MLLRDGATPVCNVDDIFAALSLAPRPLPTDDRPEPAPAAQAVLAATGWEPTPLDVLVARTGLSPAALALQLQHLAMDGWVAGAGGWWQRLA